MKAKRIPSGLLACGMATLLCVHAQAVSGSDKLEQAIGLLETGQSKEARAVLAAINNKDASYPTAQGLDALCLYQLDKRQFYDLMRTQEFSAALPEVLREELDYRQIDTLLFYRKFEELLSKTTEFAKRHADSPRKGAMAEYQMAGLYERGIKKLTEAALLRGRGDGTNAQKRLQEGEDDLGQFLKLAADREQNNYLTLTNRNLSAEVVKVMAVLGGEEESLKMVSSADREEMALAVVRLHKKTDADADANLWRMTNFLNQFPNTRYRPRVQYDMADVALNEGWRLNWQIGPVKAAPYLDKARRWFSAVVADPAAGISEADVQESRLELLRVFYAQQDWAGLSNQVAQVLANASVGGRDWLAARLYDAAGLACQMKLTEAARELDELLTNGFKNHPTCDGLMVSAAAWRVRVAKTSGDKAAVERVAKLVQTSDCYDSLKRRFEEHFKELAALTNTLNSVSK